VVLWRIRADKTGLVLRDRSCWVASAEPGPTRHSLRFHCRRSGDRARRERSRRRNLFGLPPAPVERVAVMGMRLDAADLLPGELVVVSKNANALVRVSDVGLKRLPYDQGMKLLGLDGMEALGGKLYLSNFRLLFASHAFNRATGRLSIFLPSVVAVNNTSRGLSKKLEVRTALQSFEFVVWGVPALIESIDKQRQALSHDEASRLLDQVAHAPATVGDSFTISRAMDLIARNIEEFGGLAVNLVSDPCSWSTLIGLLELAEALDDEE
jgi:hypothetical protein